MTRAIGNFTPADATESEPFEFDFTTSLGAGDAVDDTIDAIWTCQTGDPGDTNPTARLTGAPYFVSGQLNITGHMAGGWVGGVKYTLSATVKTVMGSTLTLWADITGEIVGC